MGSAVPTFEPGIIHVWRGSLDQGQATYRRFESLLANDERARAARFHFPCDRVRFVVGRGMLRSLLAGYVGVDGAQLQFRYGRERKPALVGEGPYFNLAHSGATALFAFSPSFDVGVDVELVGSELEGDRIAERFFSPAEIEALQAVPDEDRSVAFLACWTRKEAFLKARGDGLTLALDSFDVSLAPNEPAALLRTGWSAKECSRWQLMDLSDREQGQVAALAAPATGWRCVRHEIDTETLLSD